MISSLAVLKVANLHERLLAQTYLGSARFFHPNEIGSLPFAVDNAQQKYRFELSLQRN
jgi:hypothetical protein